MVMKRAIFRNLHVILAFALTAALPAAVDTTLNAADILLQQELRQSQIKNTTARVGTQLDGIIDEFERNGLAGDDVAVLKAIRGVLGSLTQKEIDQVIELLQAARVSNDPSKSSEKTMNAYAGQKSIIVQLRHLLLEYERQQIIREIARRLALLGKRQGNNMHETIALAKATLGRDARRGNEAQRISLQLQSTEQATINDESQIVIKKLTEVVAAMDGIAAEKPRAAVARAEEGRLLTVVAAATGDLKTSNLLSAAGNEKRARDLFVEISRMLRPDRDKLQVLKEALKELDQAIEEQKKVADEASQLNPKRRDEDLKQQVEKHQMQVVDQTALVREDVLEHAPKAASELKESIERMQEARAELNDFQNSRRRSSQPDSNPVTAKQSEALKKMEAAKKDLEEQIAKTEEQKDQPKDKVQELKELLAEVRELSRQQEAINRSSQEAKADKLPAHSAQQEIQKAKTMDAQVKATPLLKPAAESLAEAVKQMDKAAKAMATKLDAPASQQAATDALKRAESQLAQEVVKLEEAQQELAKLDELGKKVAELIQNQQKVQLETAKVAQLPKSDAAKQAQVTAPKQQQLTRQTAAATEQAQKDAPKAARDLEQAENNMAKATRNLARADAATAREDQSKALDNLQNAQRAIERKKDELEAALGMPEESKPDMLAQASQAVSAAQMEVNKAVNQLNKPASLQEFLKEEQAALAKAVSAAAAQEPKSKALVEAKEATQEAANALSRNKLAAAIGQMAKAQQQLAAAAQSSGKQNPSNQSDRPDAAKPASTQPNNSNLPQLAKQQGDLKEIATTLAQISAKPATAPLDKANAMIAPLTSGEINALPLDAQLALRQAQRALTEASAKASANQATPAQQNAQLAQETLSQAASALALAQKGLGNQSEEAQQMAQGESGRGKSDQVGKGQAKGPGKNKASDDSKEGRGDGSKGNFNGQGDSNGRLRQVADRNTFIGLPSRERNAILQSMGEKYPEEFGPLVEQYLKNLSDASSKK